MSSAPNANVPRALPREPSITAALLSYVVPGLGQISQGRYGKGLLFMVALLGMFYLGQALGQWQNVYLPRPERGGGIGSALWARWHFLGQFWIGASAWPAVWQYLEKPMGDKETNPFWHYYQKAPDERDLNAFLVNSDKTPDLGWVYTVIAGMLNILVIYDAYAGPAFLPILRPTTKPPPAPQVEAAQGGAL